MQVKEIKERMLNWASQFSILLFLDSNNYVSAHGSYECLLATGQTDIVSCPVNVQQERKDDLLLQLQKMYDVRKDWIFGHIHSVLLSSAVVAIQDHSHDTGNYRGFPV